MALSHGAWCPRLPCGARPSAGGAATWGADMAAISGMLRFDGAPGAGELTRRIAGCMSHRSPGGIRGHDACAVALGFGALHPNPQSLLEIQPVLLPEDALLVVDGRIDDRAALSKSMGFDRSALADTGDAQLFALAWLRWRENLWRNVLGDYALAVWEPARGQLSLVRDRIGVRPLYWARTASMLAFASRTGNATGDRRDFRRTQSRSLGQQPGPDVRRLRSWGNDLS
mgnify:CR=1 FL=1